jgi:hypothetical protein
MKGQLPCLQAGSAPTIQTSDCLGDTKWCRDALTPQMAGFVRNGDMKAEARRRFVASRVKRDRAADYPHRSRRQDLTLYRVADECVEVER